jgi:hypothetical protein
MSAYKCAFCTKIILTKDMNLHLRANHQNVEKKYKCGEKNCIKVFSKYKTFKKHLQTMHHQVSCEECCLNPSEREFTCTRQDHQAECCPNTTEEAGGTFEEADGHPPNQSERMFDSMLKFVLYLYGISNMPRSTATQIINRMWTLIVKEFTIFIKNQLNSSQAAEVEEIFKTLDGFFKRIDTEHKVLKLLEDKGLFIPPETITIKTKLQQSHKNGVPYMKTMRTSTVMISLSKLFKKILELPGVFSRIFAHVEKLQNSQTFTNFIQSPLWKSKIADLGNVLVLPYFYYFDDYVNDNPIGPKNKNHSMANNSITLPFLPTEIESKLDNSFLFYLYKSKDKILGNKLMLSPAIDEMRNLEENGIDVNIEGQIFNVKFIMSLVLGDNLGLHEILGFVKGFRANFPCRMCKISKENMVKCCTEDSILFRNASNYKKDVEINNVSETGVQESCVFNEIKSFNVWENYSFDLMHDLLEGVFHYDLGHIFQYFFTKKYLTLEILNDRKAGFDYGPMKIGNMTEPITKDHISKKHFRFSASEMLCFVQNLTFMIGCYIPEDDDVWLFFLDLLKILDIVMDPCVTESNLRYLDSLVYSHHKFYIDTFKDNLKNKHHNMIHYSTVIRKIGPLLRIWCMRLESLNKGLKDYGKNITCRKNLAKSVATKEQLKLSDRFFSNTIINWNETVVGSKVSDAELKKYMPLNLPAETQYFKWIKYNGIKYTANLIVPFDEEDSLLPSISKILFCFMLNGEFGLITTNDVQVMGYNEHFHCFVARTNANNEIKVVNIKNSTYAPTFLHHLPNSSDFGFLIRNL